MKYLPALFFVLLSSAAYGWADGGGSGGGGCCGGLPAELQEAGRALEKSFSETTLDDLRTQRWSGALCTFHPCGEGVSEELAKELLVDYLQDQNRRNDQWFAWAGFGLGILGLLIAFAAMVWTIINDRRSRAANDRSIRNETLIEVIREELKT